MYMNVNTCETLTAKYFELSRGRCLIEWIRNSGGEREINMADNTFYESCSGSYASHLIMDTYNDTVFL